jgi:hypothetical protein
MALKSFRDHGMGCRCTIVATGEALLAPVKTHVSRLLGKLDCRDRTQFVVVAYETGVAIPGQR